MTVESRWIGLARLWRVRSCLTLAPGVALEVTVYRYQSAPLVTDCEVILGAESTRQPAWSYKGPARRRVHYAWFTFRSRPSDAWREHQERLKAANRVHRMGTGYIDIPEVTP